MLVISRYAPSMTDRRKDLAGCGMLGSVPSRLDWIEPGILDSDCRGDRRNIYCIRTSYSRVVTVLATTLVGLLVDILIV